MASESGSPLLAFIRHLAASPRHGELTDSELLQRFAVQREEAAFTTLLQRHGPMVLGVCRSILPEAQDAEDAFQATFLVLARQPRSIGKPASVASWLHGVAYRLAMRARAEAARRRAHERQAVMMPKVDPHEELIWRDLRPVLHEEVDRLPERYRLPFVLCYLEGKTNEEAADLLGWPKGTVLSSLSRARERLRRRLTRRGLALTSGLLAALLAPGAAQAAVPPALAESTARAALLFATGAGTAGGIAAPVLASAKGILHAALVAQLKLAAVILLGVIGVGVGVGVLVERVRTQAAEAGVSGKQPPPGNVAQGEPPPQPVADADRLQGAWIIAAAEQRGQGTDVLTGRRLVFRGGRFTLEGGDGEVSGIIPRVGLEGDFGLKPTDPKRIDLSQRNWRLHGIYALDGRDLKICLSEAGANDPPPGFATRPGSRQLLLLLKRE
jgi:RNA polymerase sigma factor (sigma-70 family)